MIAFKNDRWSRELEDYEAERGNVIEHFSRLPTHDEIEVRAYEIFLRKGRQEGRCEEDWLEAERELMEEMRGGHDEGVMISAGASAL